MKTNLMRCLTTSMAPMLFFFSLSAMQNAGAETWAHRSKLVNLQPNGTPLENDDIGARLKIQEAFARWGFAYDENRSNVIASLFTNDAVYQVNDQDHVMLTVTGIKAIVDTVTKTFTRQNDQRRHLISNIIIERLSKTAATVVAYAMVTAATDTEVSLSASVLYSTELKLGADGIWRFSKMVIGMDHYNGTKPNIDDASDHGIPKSRP